MYHVNLNIPVIMFLACMHPPPPPIDLNTYWGKVGMYIWKGLVVHVAIITKYVKSAMTCNLGHQAICHHPFASHGGPNMT